MSEYKITGIIYIHIGMNLWGRETLYTRISTQNNVFKASDAHMHASVTELHIMSLQPAAKAVKKKNSQNLCYKEQ